MAKAAESKENDKLMSVTFFQQPGESTHYTPCLNGIAWQIERGVKVDVPKSLLHVADLAVITVIEQDGKGGEIKRDIPRVPYIIHGEAS